MSAWLWRLEAVFFGTRSGAENFLNMETMFRREHSLATWCKRLQIDLWNLHDRMKAGELILYEKRGEDEVNVTHAAMTKIKELNSGIERALLDE